MRPVLYNLLGKDCKVYEMFYLTTCKSAEQRKHADTCSYQGNNRSGHCKDYYQLFVATQHVSLAMGGTIVYPNSHNSPSLGVKGNDVQTVLNPGDALLYNWRLRHQAGENLLYNARIMLAVSFESEGKGMIYVSRKLSMCAKAFAAFATPLCRVR